jgi:hypothetical protein
VDRREYEYCLSSIKGLAFPNKRGLSIRSSIQLADEKISVISGLGLWLSTAIGRSMAFDENFTYVVTTVAITCTYFPHDLVAWVLSHLHGKLEISVCGPVVYEEKLGISSNSLLIMVKTACNSSSASCNPLSKGSVQMAIRVGRSFRTLVNEISCYTVAKPADRQNLYSTSVLYHCQYEILNAEETACVQSAAQSMLQWLLDIEVKPHWHAVSFVALQGRDDEKSSIVRVKLQDLFARYPSFLFKNTGKRPPRAIVY